ncbi:MAG: polysaccharide biosynthesis C-terminal domain-containing protein [Reichenbachiella sp.]
MAGLKNLAGDTIWYGLSSIIARLISWLLVPLHTGVFATGEYGIVTELYALVAFLYVIFTYGMETAYFRFAKNSEKEKDAFNLSFSAIFTTSLIFSCVLIFFSQNIVAFFGYPNQAVVVYYLAAIISIDAIVSIPYARLRFEKKAKKFALIKFIQIILTVLLNLFFFVFCIEIINGNWFPSIKSWVESFYDQSFKVKYVFIANLVANAAILLLLFGQFKSYKYSLNWNKLKPILIYAFPLLFMGLAGVTNEMLSRTLLTSWLPEDFYPGQSSKAALGVFGACYKLSMLMILGVQAFRYAAEPFFFSKSDEKGSPQLFARIMSGFVAFNTIVFLSVSVNLEPISYLFLTNPEYHAGLNIVPFLLLGYLFSGIYYNLSVWYKLTDRTKYGAIITTGGAILTVLLNYFLIPVLGYFGSSLVTLITFFGMALVSYVLGQKYFPIPYKVFRIVEYILVSSTIAFIAYNLDLGHWFSNFVIRNVAVLVYIIYLYLRERDSLSGITILGIKIP